MGTWSVTLQEEHLSLLLKGAAGPKRLSFVLCGKAKIRDPWDDAPHEKFLDHELGPIGVCDPAPEDLSRLYAEAESRDLRVLAACSPHEIEWAQSQLAPHGANTPVLVLGPDGGLSARWASGAGQASLVRVVGDRFRFEYPGRGSGMTRAAYHRQALAFGPALNQDLSMLRVGVVGGGATGSAVAMLTPRLGFGRLLLADRDRVEDSNLSRLHGARQADADAMRSKVAVLRQAVSEAGLGTKVVAMEAWASEPACLDALKACDVIFACTDDDHGRLVLNRLAYFYLIPVLDLGAGIDISMDVPPKVRGVSGRVTVLAPRHTCLLCREVIDPAAAAEEALRRSDPDEYRRRKTEAYVRGEGNPRPAVVTFTTELACMAMNEFLHRVTGFKGEAGSSQQVTRLFDRFKDVRQDQAPRDGCPVCASTSYWGRGDVSPSLDLVL